VGSRLTAKWAVRDDQYSNRDGEEQDDDWNIGQTSTTVDWKWTENRTDGGAYTGFGEFDGTAVVDPGFNEDAAHWGEWDDSGDPAYYMEEWVVKGADGSTVTTLDMDRQLFVHPGGCLDTAPETSLSGPEQVEPDTNVTFEATASTDSAAAIGGFEWDFDGDDEVDEVTTEPTVTRTFSEGGDHTVSVTAFDTYGNSATDQTTVTVVQAPSASLDVPAEATAGETVTLDASGSTDDGTITEYRWDFDGDGIIDQNTTSSTVDHVYNETGDAEPSVTVVDDDGATDTASETLTVQSSNGQPTASLDAPAEATVNQSVTFDASGSTDDGEITEYRWDFDGDDTVDATTQQATIEHVYNESGR